MIKVYNGDFKKDDIEMRKVYSTVLSRLMEKDNRIVALEADLMSSMTMDAVQKEKPDKVINCGIMEANMIGVAGGMSIAGKYPFVHTFTAFASRRCFDQLFMSAAYQKNNIKVIASDAGVTAVHNGGTHMSFEDMGIMRGLANTVVMEMTDGVMFENVLEQIALKDGFYWIRTMRKNAATVYEKGSIFEIGKGNVLKDGNDITLIANGIMVCQALEAAKKLEKEGKSVAVIDMFTLNPIDKELIIKYADKTGKIITCENHSIHNGLGSAVAEVMAEKGNARLKRIGIKERYGQVGTLDFLMEEYELTSEHIYSAALELLK
ncbi:transketolase family protein [Leptotrichia sp. OH3620_COT-345]|uniref:transketolase family protein n=1 Tax=Leptotrichia sp. OH3620_COT-345 TaxID=2491048 RepID=UPI000F6479D6|nr:transketolase family protein [Leptotrichia sp. OH3620_COT-345]RRD40502.1 transketolase family protein [Leptotrichia sp. OH3620_COT-345]